MAAVKTLEKTLFSLDFSRGSFRLRNDPIRCGAQRPAGQLPPCRLVLPADRLPTHQQGPNLTQKGSVTAH